MAEDCAPTSSSASGGLAWHTLTPEEVARTLETAPDGLDPGEARERLRRYGPNAIQEAPPPSPLVLFAHQFASPLIYILMAAAAVTLVLGEYIDSAVIGAVLLLNAVIGFAQERRAEESVRGLMQLVSPQAHVVRAGRERVIDSSDLVPGDVVLLESGVRVPADLRLVSANALAIDESLLTGESTPVSKAARTLDDPQTPLGDRVNMAFSGSVVASGRGRGYVVATGMQTELGAIASSVRQEKLPKTPLQQRMDRFARIIGVVVAASSVLAFAIGLATGESPRHMFTVAVALAVAAIPEGLPVVFTITLARGVHRMARRNAIIRRLPAVETLGSTTVIGSDKTGTLTENRMTVRRMWSGGEFIEIGHGGSEDRPREGSGTWLALLAGVLASEAHLAPAEQGEFETQGDPTEVALLVAAARQGLDVAGLRAEYEPVVEIPFEPEKQYSASVRRHGDDYLLFVKGAPERLVAMSDSILADGDEAELDPDVIHEAGAALAGEGLRVLAMAYRPLEGPPPDDFAQRDPGRLVFLGLQGMLDPPREGVAEAIRGCREAGIRVLMITGDHAATARSIGRELGIGQQGAPEVLTGREIDDLDDAELRERVAEVDIYARASPEHKLRVVRALRRRGETVAVTGDGVNDAPALRAADIGIAMGVSGTDVAREAADMVLADDNFASIYAAVEEGRITFDNVRKVTFFLVSTGAAAILTILAALVLGWPVPMVAAQLLWLNLVTKGLQDVALAFEPGEPGVLKRAPRPEREGIISLLLWERSVVTAIVMAAGTLWIFRWELDRTDSLVMAQTVALTTLVIYQMFHVGNSRSDARSLFGLSPFSNRFLFLATVGAVGVHVAALYLPPTQYILRVEPLSAEAWVRIVALSGTILVAIEAHKFFRNRVWPLGVEELPARPGGA
jgi:calcium-translocating P-type ATPase